MSAISSSSSTHSRTWESVLSDHPIFDPSAGSSGDKNSWKADDPSLELSINSLSKSTSAIQDGGIPNGRRRTMLIKDADLIVAVGKQVRMTSLTESQLSDAGEQTFKVGVGGFVRMRDSCLHTVLDLVHARPAISNPRTHVKPERTSARCSGRIPGRGNCTAATGVYKTRAINNRLQVRLGDQPDFALVNTDWAGLCKSASSTTLLALHHRLPRSIGTRGARVALPSW